MSGFNPPQTKQVVLNHPIFVKGKGLPKDGVCLFREGETVTAYTDNGAEWYLMGHYKGQKLKIATLLLGEEDD